MSATLPMLELCTNDDDSNKSNRRKKFKSPQSAAGYKRLIKEIQGLLLRPPSGIAACLYDDDDLMNWFAIIDGPQNTPYYGGTFYLNIHFKGNYPFDPPKVTFKTKIYHCNIRSDNGEICLDVLKDKYSPALTVEKILLSVVALLSAPNPADPLDGEIAKVLVTNKKLHDETARKWTKRYAMMEEEIDDNHN